MNDLFIPSIFLGIFNSLQPSYCILHPTTTPIYILVSKYLDLYHLVCSLFLSIYHFQLHTHPPEYHLNPIELMYVQESHAILYHLPPPLNFLSIWCIKTQLHPILIYPIKPTFQHNETLCPGSIYVSSQCRAAPSW